MRIPVLLCAAVLVACPSKTRSYVPLEGVPIGGDTFSGTGGAASAGGDTPVLSLSSPPSRVRGGSEWTAEITVFAKHPIAGLQLQYAADGEHVDSFVDVAAESVIVPWVFARADTIGSRLRLIAVDADGRIGAVLSTTFTIDSTGPLVPAFTLDAPALTNLRAVSLRIQDCTDVKDVLVTEATAFTGNEPEYLWQPCVTTPGRAAAPFYVLGGADGDRTLSVWARDDVGNPSLGHSSQTLTLDTTPPVVAIVSPADGALIGPADAIAWTASDEHLVPDSVTVQLSNDGGASFADLATAQPASGSLLPMTLMDDGYRLRVSAVDAAGNVGSATSGSDFTSDRTPPDPPSITLLSSSPTNDSAVLLAVTDCGDRPLVLVTESVTAPAADDAAWQTCSPTLPAFSLDTMQGAHTISVWSQDAAGNVSASAASVMVTFDSLQPALTLDAPVNGGAIAAGATYRVKWTMSDANLGPTPIKLTASVDGGGPVDLTTMANTGFFDWIPIANPTIFTATLQIEARDLANNVRTISAAFIIAKDPPAISLLRLNGATGGTGSCSPREPDTQNPIALAELVATDPNGANITHICFKRFSSNKPAASDPCFQPILAPTLSPSIHLYDVPARLGYVVNDGELRVWMKNAAGLVSDNTGSECADMRLIKFDPGSPPLVSNVTSFSTNTPADPYVPNDATLDGSHPNVFVKWNASLPNGAATGPTGPITLEYTTDDFNYAPIPGSYGVSGAVGCSASTGYTGCAVWAAPTGLYGSYVKVRVRATDKNDISSVSSSLPPLNVSPMRFLAGNPDPGYGGNAASTLFMTHITTSSGEPKLGTLAVSSRGVVYHLDRRYGIQWVDPSTGNTDTLVRIDGTTADGAVKVATARDVFRITMDHDDNLLFWDYDRIRRINVNPDHLPTEGATVTTIIGGGSDTNCTGDDQDPLAEVKVCPLGVSSSLWALPNGDIYFVSSIQTAPSTLNAEFAVRHYVKTRNRVDTIRYSGNGWWSMYYPASALDAPAASVTNTLFHYAWLAYDPTTSVVQRIWSYVYNHPSYGYGLATFDATGHTVLPPVMPGPAWMNLNAGLPAFTGMDGNFYIIDMISNLGIYRYDVGANTWTRVVGGGTAVQSSWCDDTLQLGSNCRIDVQDAFVDAAGHIYWSAFGKIYTLNEAGETQKIMGQGYEFGDGGPALAARFGYIANFDYWRAPSGPTGRDRLVTVDSINVRYRETLLGNGIIVDGTENKVTHLAGSGRFGYASQYYDWSWNGSSVMEVDGPTATGLMTAVPNFTTLSVDRSNGFVYPALGYYYSLDYSAGHSRLTRLRRDRAGPQWEGFAGGGAVSYSGAVDGTRGRAVSFDSVYSARSIGVNNGKALYQFTDLVGGVYGDAMLEEFQVVPVGPTGLTGLVGVSGGSGAAMTRFAGLPVSGGPYCPNGTLRTACNINLGYNGTFSPGVFDDGDADTPARWLIASDWTNQYIKSFAVAPTGTVNDVAAIMYNARSWTFRRIGNRGFVYWCNDADGHIWRQQVEPIVGPYVELSWPVPERGMVSTLQCRGHSMRWHPERVFDTGKVGTIIFSYEQYGLMGLAEYYDPPPP